MILSELIQELSPIQVYGSTEKCIDQITYHSKAAGPNSLFVCIRGFRVDGHDYIPGAVANGAVALLTEAPVFHPGITTIQVADTRDAMGKLASRFYGRPDQELKVVGVTGTNGKTSITYLLKAILEGHGHQTGLMGTLETVIGSESVQASRTTPESLDIHATLRKMLDRGLDSCVMEVSSHALELARVREMTFEIGIFTNLSPDHLDFHQNMTAYRQAKEKLFYQTRRANVLNLDDGQGALMAEKLRSLPTPLLTYGIKAQADFKAEQVAINGQEARFQVKGPDFQETFTIGIPAQFAVYNCLAVIAAAWGLGVSPETIKKSLAGFKGVRGRFERVEAIQDLTVIVDFAHTPDALENVLKGAREHAPQRLITVVGCGGDRDRTKRPLMGEIAGRYSDLTVITSDNPRTEEPMKIIEMVEAGVKTTGKAYTVVENRREAIEFALKNACKKDMIMIVGKGHETTQILKDRIIPFDDRQIVLEIAREEGIQ